MAKSATCLWCGEGIEMLNGKWTHVIESDDGDCLDHHVFCYCHCAKCDPVGGLDQGNDCIDGEPATPDLLTIKEDL